MTKRITGSVCNDMISQTTEDVYNELFMKNRNAFSLVRMLSLMAALRISCQWEIFIRGSPNVVFAPYFNGAARSEATQDSCFLQHSIALQYVSSAEPPVSKLPPVKEKIRERERWREKTGARGTMGRGIKLLFFLPSVPRAL